MVEHRGVEHPVVDGTDATHDDDEQRPAQHRVDDDRCGTGSYAKGQDADAQDDDRRWHEVDAGPEQAREAQSSVLAGGSEPAEDAGSDAAQHQHDERHEEPPAEPRRSVTPGGPRSGRACRSDSSDACRSDLAGGDEADQDRLDEEAQAEHRVGSGSRRSQLGEHLFD